MIAITRPASVLLLVLLTACGDDSTETSAPSDSPVDSPAASDQPQAPARRRLADAEARPPGTGDLARWQRVDFKAGLSTGQTTLEANDGRFQSSVVNVIDGDVATLAISSETNPVVLTVTLDRPIRLRAVRVFPAGSPYDWLIEPAPGGERLLIESAPGQAWSQIDLDEPVETSVMRLEFLRLERDDFVHVNEIELYAEPAP